MNTFINTMISITISSSTILLIVTTIKTVFSEKLNIKILMFLWILALARLLIPFTIESPVHFDSFTSTNESPSITAENTNLDNSNNNNYSSNIAENTTDYSNYNVIQPSNSPGYAYTPVEEDSNISFFSSIIKKIKSVDIRLYAFAVWSVVMTMILLRTLYLSIAFRKMINQSNRIPNIHLYNILSSAQRKLNVNLNVQISQSKLVDVPIVFGIFKPVILIPKRLYEETDSERLTLIIMHELSHIKRNDVLKNVLWLIAKAMHWFNPLVWMAYNMYLDDVEFACDNMVTRSISKRESINYSQSLLDVIRLSRQRPQVPVVLSFCKDKKKLKKRVENMIKPKRTLKSASIISLIIAFVIIITCFTTACQPTPDTVAVSSKTTDIEQVVIQNNENEQNQADSSMANNVNQSKIVDETKIDFYQTPLTYVNQLSQANVDVFVDANVYGPEDNKIISVVLENRTVTQELADDFISYFAGDVQLYERRSNQRSKEEIAEEITYWKSVIYNCETNWDEARLNDPCAGYNSSADAIDDFERIIRSLEQDSKSAPTTVAYNKRSGSFDNNRIIAYVQSAEGSFKNMAHIYINKATSSIRGSLMYDNKGSWRDSNQTIEEIADTGLTLEYAIEQATIAAQHFGIQELYLDGYRICKHFKNGEYVPFINMSLSPAFNSIGSPMLFDGTQLGFSAAAASPPHGVESIDVCVDPDGIIGFSWTTPQNRLQVIDDDVNIMNFDEAISIFEQKIMYTLYTGGTDKREVHINRIQLSLMPIKKIDSNQTVLVPVWDFRGYFYDPTDELWAHAGNVVNETDLCTFLTINAIDGSIINRELGY